MSLVDHRNVTRRPKSFEAIRANVFGCPLTSLPDTWLQVASFFLQLLVVDGNDCRFAAYTPVPAPQVPFADTSSR